MVMVIINNYNGDDDDDDDDDDEINYDDDDDDCSSDDDCQNDDDYDYDDTLLLVLLCYWPKCYFCPLHRRSLFQILNTFPSMSLGDPTDLYEAVVSKDITVVQGCGLGGGSLINAAVGLDADPKVFEDTRWPQEIRDDLEVGCFSTHLNSLFYLKTF